MRVLSPTGLVTIASNRMLTQKNVILACLLIALLAACGPSAVEPTPRPALVPRAGTPPAAARLPTAGAEMALPGRLLFVSGGNLWLWQGRNGAALTGALFFLPQ